MPLPPADFGAPRTATVRANDRFLQDVTRECAPFTHDCDDECVTGPEHGTPVARAIVYAGVLWRAASAAVP